MRYLTLGEVLAIRERLLRITTIGAVRDLGLLESAIAQPQATFDGRDLYPTIEKKAAALAYSLSQNQPFTDGNSRIAYTATVAFLRLNGHDIESPDWEEVDTFERLARGEISSEKLADWIRERLI